MAVSGVMTMRPESADWQRIPYRPVQGVMASAEFSVRKPGFESR